MLRTKRSAGLNVRSRASFSWIQVGHAKRRTKNNFLFSFPLTLPSPARGEGEKAKLFFVCP
jgi:hypothetical protein